MSIFHTHVAQKLSYKHVIRSRATGREAAASADQAAAIAKWALGVLKSPDKYSPTKTAHQSQPTITALTSSNKFYVNTLFLSISSRTYFLD